MNLRTTRPPPPPTSPPLDGALSPTEPLPGRRPVARWASRSAARLRAWLDVLWKDWRIGAVVALVVVASWGWAAGRWTPRGPLTTGQALWSIVVSVAVGVTAGLATRSRWVLLAGPLVFVAVLEIARAGTDGPTVDGIHFSTYGLLALAVGRGFHALVSWLPMLWGAALGAGVARSLQPSTVLSARRRWPRYTRRGVAIVAAAGLVAFSVLLARPARTDRIVGADGEAMAGSVAELRTVDVNGHDLAMMIRGHDTTNPVLLFLAGGPGGSELGAMRNHLPSLEEHFTVVTFDQRGTGKSYRELDPTSTLTLDGAVADVTVVTDYLRDRFGQDRVYLLGQSWGSTLGVLAVQKHPESYRAFIGVGQMVSQLATDRIFYDDTLAWARTRGDKGLADQLTDIGPPPYDDMLDYETALSYEHEVYPYDHTGNSEGEGGFSENFLVEEYAVVEQVHLLAGFMDTFAALYPQLQHIDFRQTATRLDVPVFFVQGAHEAPGRAQPFTDWYATLEAPAKDLIVFDTSGHRPLFEQPDRFVEYMTDTVVTQTAPAS